MKTIFKIHPFFYLFMFICLLTGYFKNFIIIISIILFHELGHILSALYFKWNIEKIIILPFGALTLFKEKINKPIYEEIIITLMGPIFQIILFLFFNDKTFNLSLLLFNLIPIYPLDGSKLLNLILNKIFSFKNSHIISNIVSFLLCFVMFIYCKNNLILLLSIILFLYKTVVEIKNHKYLFNKFLFERYLYNFNFKKQKKVKKITNMKRDYRHLLYIDKKYQTERYFLKHLFDNSNKL